jgi:hypothetical protein
LRFISNKVTSRSYGYFLKFSYFYFLRNFFFQQCQKLHSLVKKSQGILGVNTILEPTTIKQALASSNAREWQLVIDFEIKSLIQIQTWRITPLPSGRKPITSKWIFKVKYNVDGSINKYKALLVAKGFTQVDGLDYTETFPLC